MPHGTPRAETGDRRAAIVDALDVRVRPPRVTWLYRAGLVLVAVALLLLPVIYVGLIGVVGYAIYWHATEHIGILGARWTRVWAYFAPIAIGMTLLLFMVKPLFVRSRRDDDAITLDREQEPFLFAFVDRLCDAVGARRPASIRIDSAVNASAGLDGLWSGMVRGQLILTIGLPLVGGLSLREFAGVLAHEFGHFTQAAGMRAYYCTAVVNRWFARVVHERDRWDDRLVAASKEGAWVTIAAAGLARLFVWLTRRILAALMWVGRLISSFMSRQMEFDADHYEIQLAGSEAFCDTAVRMTTLSIAADVASGKLGVAWGERRLADDFPGLVRLEHDRLAADVADNVRASFADERLEPLATHPRNADRIAAAERAAAQGLFTIDDEPETLFDRLEEHSRAVTLQNYARATDGHANETHLIPLAEFVERDRREAEAVAAMQRVFQTNVSYLAPLRLAADAEKAIDAPAVERLVALRDRVVAVRGDLDRELRALGTLEARACDLGGALVMAEVGVRLDHESFELPDGEVDTVRDAHRELLEAIACARAKLQPMEAVLAERVAVTLACAARVEPPAADAPDRLPDGAEVSQLLDTIRTLEPLIDDALELDREIDVLRYLLGQAESQESDDRFRSRIENRGVACRERLETVRARVGDRPYPFEHTEDMTWAAFLVPTLPRPVRTEALIEAADLARSRSRSLYFRAVGQLAVLIESIERSLALDPLPTPPQELMA